MCGIAGYVDPAGANEARLRPMVDRLVHRGPDGEGLFVRADVALGHRRLSIIDLAGGAQPMGNPDGSVWITFNGEIYNYRELRRDLLPDVEFRTSSDTEVILHLYERFGAGCVRHLRGMFAFGLYDFRARRLVVARDHLGQKPLYYSEPRDGVLAFGSEIKALLAFDPGLARLDPHALHEYLQLRIITAPRSMFQGVRKLPAGHVLVFENGQAREERYWTLDYTDKLARSDDDLVEELDARVREAVRYHLVSDVPVGAFLSGGMDSSLVVAMMAGELGKPFKTFSGDVPYAGYSEMPYARAVATRYHTESHELTIEPSLVRTLPELVWHLDEPSDPLSVCLYYISRLARREVKVVLGGDGGDELFGGYDRYYGNVYVSYYALLPEWVRRRVIGPVLRRMPEGFWYRSTSHKLRWIHQMSFHGGSERYARSLGYFYCTPEFQQTLYTPGFREAIGSFDAEAAIRSYFDSDNASEAVDRMLYADSMTRMPDHPVMILDRMTMAHGLESRSPFMDHELAAFCARLPVRCKVRGRRLRWIQGELARRYLPPELLNRGKQGFASALTYTLAGEFRLLYRVLLGDSRLVEEGILRAEGVRSLLDEHLAGRADHGQRLWLLCNAEIWYRSFIDGQDRAALHELIDQAA